MAVTFVNSGNGCLHKRTDNILKLKIDANLVVFDFYRKSLLTLSDRGHFLICE